ncbi:MAG: hypothetical protein JW861_00280 [Bacteroidales bacterium]|nr:hypothetical protein [Bacteroidales bacterium]
MNDLIRFTHNETAEDENGEFHRLLSENGHFMKRYAGFSASRLILEGYQVSPPQRIIRNLMGYSRALVMVETRQTGNLPVILN